LHTALRYNRVSVIHYLLQNGATKVLEVEDNSDNGTPLHFCCGNMDNWHHGYLNLLEVLSISAKAVKAKDQFGRTPFHVLCKNGGSREHMQILVDKCAQLPCMRDNEGCTPLHLAMDALCTNPLRSAMEAERYHASVVSYLLELFPQAVKAKDHFGRTPFHVLCKNGGLRESMQVLVDKCAQSACMRDNEGHTPLHLAIEGTTSMEDAGCYHATVSYLLEFFPNGVRVRDNDAMMPIELACQKDIGLSLIYQLVSVDPIMNLGLH
jgi:ankyrin repeat protein